LLIAKTMFVTMAQQPL